LDGVPCPGMCSGIRLAAWTILAALILAGCTGTTNESGKHTTATSPPSLVIPSASLTLSGKDMQDVEFIALLIKWAKRDNYPLGDRDQLIAAGAQVCASIDRGETLITASADLMDTFGFSGKQAQAVGVAAVQVYCPEHN
jgi:Protein of unknown function (DUF732)